MKQSQLAQQAHDHYRAERFPQAEAACRTALLQNPRDADAMYWLAMIASRFSRPDAAAQLLADASTLRPDSPAIFSALGTALLNANQLRPAQTAFERAIALSPRDFDAHHNLAVVHERLARLPQAAECFRAAVNISPANAFAHLNLATILRDLGRLDESIHHFQRAIALDPSLAHAHMGLAWVMLLRGDFRNGWAEYEWRWRVPGASLPKFPQPVWDGSPLPGRTIMLHCEQGLGDSIQFSRYATLLAGHGAKVILFCPAGLVPLLATVPGATRAVSQWAELGDFDVWLPLMSLPHRIGTTSESIPGPTPYISVDDARSARWRDRIAADNAPGLKVGLCWAGNRANINDVNRSIPPEMLAPLLAVSGITFYNLQLGNEPRPPGLIDHTPAIQDFADSAAFIHQLDLVISADTAVAHLAGAIGKPVWTLLPYAPDWRWLLDRDDSPWYPTMRLFRKAPLEPWPPLLERVRSALANLKSQA
jgi:Flp pilus assembly protein TadD